MNADDIVAQLRDIHLPESGSVIAVNAVTWWPVVAYLVVVGLWVWRWRRQRTQWRRQVYAELNLIDGLVAQDQSVVAWQRLAELLRRVALMTNEGLTHQDRSEERRASVTGESWLATLDSVFSTQVFVQGPGRGLIQYPYSQTSHHSLSQLRSLLGTVRDRLPHLDVRG